jgi:uncharacterized protein
MPESNLTVQDNAERSRYEVFVDGDLAGYSMYVDRADARVLLHTVIDPDYEGHGVGSALARGALDDIRAKGKAVVPRCPFVAEYISRHNEYADLVAK